VSGRPNESLSADAGGGAWFRLILGCAPSIRPVYDLPSRPCAG
jgi:hypothetical protein